jgi:transposase
MIWKPSALTRAQMEERRLAGGRLLKARILSQARIADELGVSRASVCDWAKHFESGGLRRLRGRPTPGRPTKLTKQQRRELVRHLKRGALAAGFQTDRWTLQRIRELIERLFGVTYHPNYLNRFLRKLNWTPQQPLPLAQERDEELIQAWLKKDWPRIKKGTTQRRRYRVF